MTGRWATLIGVAACMALLVAPSGAAAGTLDQSQTAPGTTPAGIGEIADVDLTVQQAQTFTAGLSGNLDQVDVDVRKQPFGTCTFGSGITVAIRTRSDSGTPGDTTLASATIPAAGVATSFGFVSVTFPAPAAVTAATGYALALSAPDASCSSGDFPYHWTGVTSNPYAGGAGFAKSNMGIWADQGDFDFGFRTFVAQPGGGGDDGGGDDGGVPPEEGGPSNDFSFGKVKRNKTRGTAKLTVKVPGAGELELDKTKKVRADDEAAEDAGKEKLAIKPKGKAKKKLNGKGKAKVKAEVTYTPDGGSPNTEDKKIKLVKR